MRAADAGLADRARRDVPYRAADRQVQGHRHLARAPGTRSATCGRSCGSRRPRPPRPTTAPGSPCDRDDDRSAARRRRDPRPRCSSSPRSRCPAGSRPGSPRPYTPARGGGARRGRPRRHPATRCCGDAGPAPGAGARRRARAVAAAGLRGRAAERGRPRRAAGRRVRRHAHGPALLVGMDTPQITPRPAGARAAAGTAGTTATPGSARPPTAASGRWAWPNRDPALLRGVPMSTADTGARPAPPPDATRGCASRDLPVLRDVDTAADAAWPSRALAPRGRFAGAPSAAAGPGRRPMTRRRPGRGRRRADAAPTADPGPGAGRPLRATPCAPGRGPLFLRRDGRLAAAAGRRALVRRRRRRRPHACCAAARGPCSTSAAAPAGWWPRSPPRGVPAPRHRRQPRRPSPVPVRRGGAALLPLGLRAAAGRGPLGHGAADRRQHRHRRRPPAPCWRA